MKSRTCFLSIISVVVATIFLILFDIQTLVTETNKQIDNIKSFKVCIQSHDCHWQYCAFDENSPWFTDIRQCCPWLVIHLGNRWLFPAPHRLGVVKISVQLVTDSRANPYHLNIIQAIFAPHQQILQVLPILTFFFVSWEKIKTHLWKSIFFFFYNKCVLDLV